MRNKYVFTKDDHCISVYKVTKVKNEESKNFGQEVETLIGHYSDMDQILKKLIFLELINKGTIEELFEDLKVVIPSVKGLISGSEPNRNLQD